jgi:hypothetical protein
MALSASEQMSGGFVRDADNRLVVVQGTFGGGGGTGTGQLQGVSISTAASGATTLVAADATRRINVVSFGVVASGAVTVQFTGTGALTGAMAFAANGGLSASAPAGGFLFQTGVNALLAIVLGTAVQVSGFLTYYLL